MNPTNRVAIFQFGHSHFFFKMKQAQKENPFNFKFNKSKHDIVGKPNPIYKKRKRTIPLEVPERSRSRLIDKRIGKSTETKSYEFEDPSHEETLTHFGQKVDDISVFPELSESEPDEPARTKSRNEIITEIIEKSKRYKRERQMQKEHDEMIRHEIDQDLETIRELMPVMNNSAYVEGSKSDYDTVMKEMSFDMRAKPTDRIKTDEELAMEAKVKLERLEKERLKRMNESSDDNHDTDEDSIERNSEVSNEIMPLTYKDGVLVNKEIFMKPCRDGGLEANESELESNISNDETDSCSESDLEEDQMSTERAPELHSDNIELPENEKSEIIAPTESGTLVEESEPPEMEELPFLFDAPATYSDFTQLLEGRDQMQTNLILERLQIQYNPKLGAENVAVLQKLMIFILKHIITVPYNQDFFAILKNHFIPMAKEFPNHYLKWIKARVIYLSSALESRRVKQKSLFSTGDLFIFQTVKQIYSISDFQHPAVTPLVLLWCQYLQTAPVLSYRDVLSKLLISQLLTDVFEFNVDCHSWETFHS